ncbi:aspartate/glutamate racemase family protein [Candidatus Bipolaricaulota bacterium]|nr:aspartate/glutamate racemase family protein [Candidatus Bipolaricaulota bacterium]
MRIGFIFVAGETSGTFFARQVSARKAMVSPGTEVCIFPLGGPGDAIETELDEALATPFILARVREAAQAGCDAIIIDCALDPALAAASTLVDVPVIGPGRSALSLAAALGDRIALLLHDAVALPAFRRRLAMYGFSERVVSVRALGLQILRMGVDRAVEQVVETTARVAVDEEGAEVVILGCTGLAPVAERVRSRLPVPLIEPVAAAVRVAESMLAAGGIPGERERRPSPWLPVLDWPELCSGSGRAEEESTGDKKVD